ncbi:MAG: beta-ketoacyl-ACP synthase II [Candidatus Cloacimonetes bacterium]|jgi:3-oxoacyl-[acyl-carrier-protein] synthase II|nr:beta-ketoacyl-ACP synthase II [Candidatus Cloacimonadota bacterium]MDD2424018.1 beta-ketoacyl-ACP synthase II [Candidatus Cloacimonadota bacterium]MDD3563547.1 beta-ketoacyl-ACP synthase II [Candidatus Cloacimonadota bacterium]MDD4277444.1 beta-ketoacyl-ACP synthase II [Candidatus Cloacimonadota bacterium]MDY0325700.1 beta-ketoacyl-ACP synthase II [Candidatus Cloacimonadaceae bacterium]
MTKRRVVITGYGAITPVGHNVSQTWQSLISGVSGVGMITHFDTSNLPVRIAAEVKNYKAEDYFDHKEARKMDLYTQFAMIAAREAVQHAGLILGSFDPERTGVITGAGIGGIQTFEEECIKCHTAGPRRISPFFIPKMIGNIAAAHISIEHNFKGINFNVMSACASANHALGTALRAIQYGDADIIISGGTEAAVTPLAVGGFSSMRALSTRNDDPASASRPFDKERDGFVMSEGAAILVLEELEHAKARGAKIYAEIAGYGASADAYHITAPTEDGEGSARAILMAIKDAGLKVDDIDYINAHGTSTPLNDKGETQSIKTVFGSRAYKMKINSTKSMVGHMLGAAAGIEAIVCIKSIETGIIHPTMNLTNPDPDCDLDYTVGGAVQHKVNAALSNSLGFGGHNSALIITRYED